MTHSAAAFGCPLYRGIVSSTLEAMQLLVCAHAVSMWHPPKRQPVSPEERKPAHADALRAQLPRRAFSAASETTHQRIKGRKRFYSEVSIREGSTSEGSGRWEVLLDGRVLRTPARSPLEVSPGRPIYTARAPAGGHDSKVRVLRSTP